MVVLLFILGTILALGFARYNESNKLFWALFLSMTVGFAGATMLTSNGNNKQDDEKTHMQVCPMQAPTVASDVPCLLADAALEVNIDESLDPAGQVNAPAQRESKSVYSTIFGSARDQPQHLFFDTS
jgi:hypothetical protein